MEDNCSGFGNEAIAEKHFGSAIDKGGKSSKNQIATEILVVVNVTMQIVRKNVVDGTLWRHLPPGLDRVAKDTSYKNYDCDYCISTIETAPP